VSWIRLEDGFPWHAKVAGLSDAAFRLHVMGLCYASAQLTDGLLPTSAVTMLTNALHHAETEGLVTALLEAGLWERKGRSGYLIHDYLAYQQSAAHVRQLRAQGAERQARFRARNAVTGGTHNGVTSQVRLGTTGTGSTGSPETSPDLTASRVTTAVTAHVAGRFARTRGGEAVYYCPCGLIYPAVLAACRECGTPTPPVPPQPHRGGPRGEPR